MALRDKTSERLFVECPLQAGTMAVLSADQVHYLANVMRAKAGDRLLLFNGRDGEWLAELQTAGKKSMTAAVIEQTRPQLNGPDITYLFAPLKRARLDYMVQKATELGVARLSPVITRRTVAERVNVLRMRANAIEAAEQCGVLRVPEVDEPQDLSKVMAKWPSGRTLVFADEAAPVSSPVAALEAAKGLRLAVLVGPEGGFDDDERRMISAVPGSIAISLGPRVMRADTAAVAALALVNAVAGDWI